MQVIPGSPHHAQLTFRDSTAEENNVLVQMVDNPRRLPRSAGRPGDAGGSDQATGSCTAQNPTAPTAADAG